MNKLLTISLIAILCSCGVNKELRQQKRCNKNLVKLVEHCPNLVQLDTIRDTVTVIVPKIEIKASLTVRVDTFELEKLVPYDKIKEVIKSISIDTLINDSLYRLQITLSNGVLSYTIQIHERIIEKPLETITQSVKIDKLTWWEEVRLYLGRWFKWVVILAVIVILLYLLNKIFNPFKK